MRIPYEELPSDIQKLFDEYQDMFGVYPDGHAELHGACLESYDAKIIKQAIKEKKDLTILLLGEDFWIDKDC